MLRNDGNAPQVRADALRFIIHFVGDLHQPLHCVSNNDMGGNCVPVDFFGNPPVEKNPQYESYAPNLHAIWDSAIIQRMKGTESVAEWANSLDQQFSSQAGGWEKAGYQRGKLGMGKPRVGRFGGLRQTAGGDPR